MFLARTSQTNSERREQNTPNQMLKAFTTPPQCKIKLNIWFNMQMTTCTGPSPNRPFLQIYTGCIWGKQKSFRTSSGPDHIRSIREKIYIVFVLRNHKWKFSHLFITTYSYYLFSCHSRPVDLLSQKCLNVFWTSVFFKTSFVLHRRKSHRFGTTWGGINDGIPYMFFLLNSIVQIVGGNPVISILHGGLDVCKFYTCFKEDGNISNKPEAIMGHKKRKGNSRDSTSASWEGLYKPSTNTNCWCIKGKRKRSIEMKRWLPRIPVHLLKIHFFLAGIDGFLDKPFIFMKSFHSTKESLIVDKCIWIIKMHLFLRIVDWNKKWFYCIAVKTPFIFKSEA